MKILLLAMLLLGFISSVCGLAYNAGKRSADRWYEAEIAKIHDDAPAFRPPLFQLAVHSRSGLFTIETLCDAEIPNEKQLTLVAPGCWVYLEDGQTTKAAEVESAEIKTLN